MSIDMNKAKLEIRLTWPPGLWIRLHSTPSGFELSLTIHIIQNISSNIQNYKLRFNFI
jgi:hypothetical protein